MFILQLLLRAKALCVAVCKFNTYVSVPNVETCDGGKALVAGGNLLCDCNILYFLLPVSPAMVQALVAGVSHSPRRAKGTFLRVQLPCHTPENF